MTTTLHVQPKFQPVLPKTVRLEVPYRSQRNNILNADAACNVTSIAMALLYFGAQPRYPEIFPQFEDELYDYTDRLNLNRHDALDLVKVVEAYGCRDRFSSTYKIADIKVALANQQPSILHGYFTSFGHLIVAVGYDDYGLIVHDPYGQWYSWGYDQNEPDSNDTKGQYQRYSYRLVENACMPDGNLWAHIISKD
jgi:hypothetical protein